MILAYFFILVAITTSFEIVATSLLLDERILWVNSKQEPLGFKNYKSWYTFFRAPNNMFVYAIVHLTFRAPKIVARSCLYTNAYLAVNYCLSIYKNIYFIHIKFVFSTENTCNIIYEGELLLIHLVRLTTKE